MPAPRRIHETRRFEFRDLMQSWGVNDDPGRVEFLAAFPDVPIFGSDLFGAAVSTLSLDEVAALLPLTLAGDPNRRRKVAQKFATLNGQDGWQDACETMVDMLLDVASTKSLRRKVLFPLRIITEPAQHFTRSRVVSALVNLGDRNSLDQAAHLMESSWSADYLGVLMRIPLAEHTRRSISLLIARANRKFLMSILDQIGEQGDRSLLRRVVARLGKGGPHVVEVAAKYGACEEMYARFKTAQPPTEAEARVLLNASFEERDYRLAIWCVGRFGYFGLLREAFENREVIEEQIRSATVRKLEASTGVDFTGIW